MRFLVLLAALCCAPVPALAQTQPPKKPPPARQADDTRSRQLLDEAQALLQRGDFAAAEA